MGAAILLGTRCVVVLWGCMLLLLFGVDTNLSSICCGNYLYCLGGCSTPPHGDGHCTVDAIHITAPPMGGTNAARQWVPHNFVAVLDRFYVQEDAYLATGILSGCTCEKESDEANCREVGRRILDKLAHENEDAALNVLPTPKIVATLKKYGYVSKMVESGTSYFIRPF